MTRRRRLGDVIDHVDLVTVHRKFDVGAQDLDGPEIGEDHDGERKKERDQRRVDGKRPVEESALESVGVKVRGLKDIGAVKDALDDEGHGEGDGDAPGGNHEGSHVTSVAGTAQVEGVGDSTEPIDGDRTQVHDGRRRQDDVTSGPGETDVEAQKPLTVHLDASNH